MPGFEEFEEFHEVDATLRGFRRVLNQMGHFPLPTRETVVAAEVLAQQLSSLNAPPLGAVGVVELRTEEGVEFQVAASGAGRIPQGVPQAVEAVLVDLLAGRFRTIRCVAPDTIALFYAPAHQDTQNFIADAARGFPGFALPGAPLGTNDLTNAIGDIRNLPGSPFGTTIGGTPLPTGYGPTVRALQRILAVAVAMRVNGFDRTQLSAATQTLTTFLRWLERHPYGDREALAANLEALAIPNATTNQVYSPDPNRPISTIGTIQSPLNTAWRVADLNRYCAEPKLFTHLRSIGYRGAVAGQLASWWDNTRPNRYTFAGGDESPYVSYMLPCGSCRNRSAEMVANLLVRPPQPHSQEAPQRRATEQAPTTRVRRHSF